MEYERIILEMLDRIKQLEEKVEMLSNNMAVPAAENKGKASNKYRHLTAYLSKQESPVKLSFGEIEEIVGFPLPASAYSYREFWANTKSHSIALSWLSIGYRTVEVSIEQKYVIFEN